LETEIPTKIGNASLLFEIGFPIYYFFPIWKA
jgi:hypothetical protein